jgi:hypothetical protein
MKVIKDELWVKLEKILHIYVFSQEAYLYTEYFHNPNTKEELDFVIKSPHSSNLSVIMHLMFRTLIVEVSKLFSRSANDKFRLSAFIDSLSSKGHFREIGVQKEKVAYWNQRLVENEEIIKDILLMRSKIYAHSDNPMTNYNNIDISFKKIKVLLDIARDILKEIHSSVFEMDLQTDSPSFEKDRFMILDLLVKGESVRMKEILDQFQNGRL